MVEREISIRMKVGDEVNEIQREIGMMKSCKNSLWVGRIGPHDQ